MNKDEIHTAHAGYLLWFQCQATHRSACNIEASKSATATICGSKCVQKISTVASVNGKYPEFTEFHEFQRMRTQSVPGPLLSFGRRGLGTRPVYLATV